MSPGLAIILLVCVLNHPFAFSFSPNSLPRFSSRTYASAISTSISTSLSPSTTSTVLSSSRNPQTGSSNITTELIAQLAIIALKLRLEANTDVRCVVNGQTRDLLFGKVGPVTVKGRGWQSPLGLTCRAIEATVQECSLDVAKVVQMRKLNLVVPAKGSAMIALETPDFGNFITHPLLKPPMYKCIDGTLEQITFEKEGVNIDAPSGAVHFQGSCKGHEFCFTLSRGEPKTTPSTNSMNPKANHREALVKASFLGRTESSTSEDMQEDEGVMEAELSRIISQYFSDLVFELDGTFLSFRDMMVTDKGKSPSVMLALSILVKKFPSPGVAF